MGTDGGSLLVELVEAEVESVVFVRDYLQFTFHRPGSSPGLSCYAWPAVSPPGGPARSFGDPGYRDELCALIGQQVTSATAGAGLMLHFAAGTTLTLRPAWSELAGPEIAVLQLNDPAQGWEVWRAGEAPFESEP